MEILIPGLILVALMVYASTRIKKRAAEAFEPETIETDRYTLRKPDGFLHVIDSPDHDFEAYSKESGDDGRARRATIDVDVLANTDLTAERDSLRNRAAESTVLDGSDTSCRIDASESANENELKVVYKLVAAPDALYRLRFAVDAKHADEYSRRIDETLDSFAAKTT